MADGNDTDNLGGRILVALFALGIVIIGLHPLKRHSESFYSWLTHDSWYQTKNVFRQLKGLAPVAVPLKIEPVKASGGEAHLTDAKVVVTPAPNTARDPKKDALNRADREELNKLIDNVTGN